MTRAPGEPTPSSAAVMSPRSPVLTPLIASFSEVVVGSTGGLHVALERVLPAGRIHLMVNVHENEFRTYDGPAFSSVCRIGGAVLEGPHSQPRVIDMRRRHLVAVEFKPGGAAPFFTSPLSETCDQLVNLEDLWSRDAARLREQLLEARTPQARFAVLEAILLTHLAEPRTRDPAMLLACAALERGAQVSAVAAQLGLLSKAFVRRFRKEFGLAPKRFSRVRRLQRVLRSIGDPSLADWADLAARHGYADQSHFINDFRSLTGMSPTEYRPGSAGEVNHVPLPQRAG